MNQEKLQQLFEYKNGKLLNNSTRSPKAVKGSEAGGINPSNGYKRIVINGKTYQYSRLVWAYHNGDIPDGLQIDHINGDCCDNRIENLRLCTPQQNEWNKDRKPSVRFESGKWRARYNYEGKWRHIGMFATKDEAEAAYWNAVKLIRNEFLRGMTK